MWIAEQAAIEATSELEKVKVSWDREIDVYSIVEHAGLPLMFRPMKRLLGAYIPADASVGSNAGILVNSNHPRSLQRYTVAHEFAHHVQDKRLSLDFQIEILERAQQMALNPRERFAEVFASWFLMPPQLVTNLTQKLGIDLKYLDPENVYQLSLTMGTSYRATITQLLSLREITLNQAAALRKWQPKEIKEKLSWDRYLSNPRNDIWVINQNYNCHSVHPRVGDEVYLSLSEIPSSGYAWARTDSGSIADLVEQRFVEKETEAPFGIEGQHEFKFAIREPGVFNLVLSMQRPWLGIQSQVDEFRIELLIEGERLGINPVVLLG